MRRAESVGARVPVEGLNEARTLRTNFFSSLLVSFGALDGGKFGQDQGSGRVAWADRRNGKRTLFMVHMGLGCPEDFLAEIGDRFAERDVTILIGIGLTPESPQQIIGEQPMSMLIVLQPPPDAAISDDMEN